MKTYFYNNEDGKQVYASDNFGVDLSPGDYVRMGSDIAKVTETNLVHNSTGKQNRIFIEYEKAPYIKVRVWLWDRKYITKKNS